MTTTRGGDKRSSYTGRTKRVANAHQSEGSSYGYLKLPSGINIFTPDMKSTYTLDFLSYIVTSDYHPENVNGIQKGDEWYTRPFKIHRDIGVDRSVIICPTSINKKCPICEHRRKRANEGASKDELSKMNTSKRNLYVLVPKGSKKFEDKMHVWDMSYKLFEEKLGAEIENGKVHEEFPDLEMGTSLDVRFKSAQFGTSKPFPEADRIDEYERSEQYGYDFQKKVPSLDKMLNVLSYEQLQNMFLDLEEEDTASGDNNFQEEEAPARTRSRRSAEPEKEKEQEQSQEEAPARRRTATQNAEVEKEQTAAPITRSRRGSEPANAECPSGYAFGVDTDTKPECDQCDLWDACMDKKEAK